MLIYMEVLFVLFKNVPILIYGFLEAFKCKGSEILYEIQKFICINKIFSFVGKENMIL
jgi:hypothetical protein